METVQQLERAEREAVFVEDAAVIRMMGLPVLEALPSRRARYEQVDPFYRDRFTPKTSRCKEARDGPNL
jgi:hypothetical protein